MVNKETLLSICIPTNGIVEWVIPVIESIYAQGVDNSLFEVVITDNGGKQDLAEAVRKYSYDNFHYYQTTAQGFTNQIDAFERCSGVFCKMLNHRSKMLPGSIEKILDIVRKYRDKKPILYFAEGHAEGGEYIECTNTDEFVQSMGAWVSWSAGTGAWRSDIKELRNRRTNKMFPHVVFLFELRKESRYVIWNGKYEQMADETNKGGYDLFKTFAVDLLDIINDLRKDKKISIRTFLYFKKNLAFLLKDLYLNEVLLPSHRTFIIKDVKECICTYYDLSSYIKIVIGAILSFPYSVLKIVYRKILQKLET